MLAGRTGLASPLLAGVLRDELEQGRVTLSESGYRIVEERFSADLLAALDALRL